MIKAKGENPDGSEILIFGLSKGNLKRLCAGDPILIKRAEMGLPHDIFIFYGETHKDLLEAIRPITDSETQVHTGGLHGSGD